MKCSVCKKTIKNGDTCYSKKGFDEIYCSKECFVEAWAELNTYEGD